MQEIFIVIKMFSIPLTFCVCSLHFSDALGSVLLCKRPAVDRPEAAVPRPLPYADGDWGGPPRDGTARCEYSLSLNTDTP